MMRDEVTLEDLFYIIGDIGYRAMAGTIYFFYRLLGGKNDIHNW